jgi:CubicO group peptidase (beta-lactamase class C family)
MTAAIGFDESGPMSGVGLGWITMSANGNLPMIVQKAGGGAGFMTYIAFAPGRDVGIFWAVNREDFNMGRVGGGSQRTDRELGGSLIGVGLRNRKLILFQTRRRGLGPDCPFCRFRMLPYHDRSRTEP